MTGLDVVIVVLGLIVVGLGSFQVATGRIVVGWRPQRRHLPLAFFRAYAAGYLFFGLLIIWAVVQKPLGPTATGVLGVLLSMGLAVSLTWAFVVGVRSRSAR